MVNLTEAINIQGESKIGDVQVAFMTASIPINGKMSINKQIQDKELFDANQEEVLKDFAAFDKCVYSLAPESQRLGEVLEKVLKEINQKDGGANAESTQ